MNVVLLISLFPLPSVFLRDAFEMPSRCVRDDNLRFEVIFAVKWQNDNCIFEIMSSVDRFNC